MHSLMLIDYDMPLTHIRVNELAKLIWRGKQSKGGVYLFTPVILWFEIHTESTSLGATARSYRRQDGADAAARLHQNDRLVSVLVFAQWSPKDSPRDDGRQICPK